MDFETTTKKIRIKLAIFENGWMQIPQRDWSLAKGQSIDDGNIFTSLISLDWSVFFPLCLTLLKCNTCTYKLEAILLAPLCWPHTIFYATLSPSVSILLKLKKNYKISNLVKWRHCKSNNINWFNYGFSLRIHTVRKRRCFLSLCEIYFCYQRHLFPNFSTFS
jgi:hypothetical protein